jgi:hypothetical protein
MRVQLKESIKVDSVILPRRAFLKGFLVLVAAPAVVKAESPSFRGARPSGTPTAAA